MNAQEAIEITKQTINRFSTVLSELECIVLKYQENDEAQKIGDEEVLKLKREIEALSIVLESAKYLHEGLINKELTKHLEHTKILYLNTEYAENKAIANSKAKRIGLEGAD